MDKVFLTILNMSLTGAFVITTICLARLPLKKAPKIISYCLWAVAGFRLAVPLSFESVVSLIPRQIPEVTAPPREMTVYIPSPGTPGWQDATLSSNHADYPTALVWNYMDTLAVIWVIGVAAMLIYGAVSYLRLKHKMASAIRVEGNIYETDMLQSPFVLGVFKPKIYLPLDLEGQEREYIILHEQTHIRRHDHIVKFAAYFILCLHWFNPLAWLAFLLMGVDMEMSCDERVLKETSGDTKKDYSMSLLSLAANRRLIGGSPLAFSEGGLKARIKNVLNFRKPSRVIIVLAVVLVAVLSVGFAVNRAAEQSEPDTDSFTDSLIEMRMVYEDNPAYFLKDMLLIADGWVYYEVPINFNKRGAFIGYADDEYSTWEIYELRGFDRDYLLAVESEDVWRVMSIYPPEAPWRQYILENPTSKQRAERMLSVSLYSDSTARLATPLISSYALLSPYYYTFADGELLIHYERDNLIARFEVVEDNTLIFREGYVPLFAEVGARYVTQFTEQPSSVHDPEIFNQVYLGMTIAEVRELFGEPDFTASGLMWFGYNNVGVFDPNFNPDGLIERISLSNGKDWSLQELISTAVKQHNTIDVPDRAYLTESHIVKSFDADKNGFTVWVGSICQTFLPNGEYDVNLVDRRYRTFEMKFAKNRNYDYVLTSCFEREVDWDIDVTWLEQNCYTDAMYHFVGLIPTFGGRLSISATSLDFVVVNNYLLSAAGDHEGLITKYFPGATFYIEPYNEENAAFGYGPGSWIIKYADSSKNITVGRNGTGEILITDDLLGIYDVNGGCYTMRFEKYVKEG